jgi:hypothetical protein
MKGRTCICCGIALVAGPGGEWLSYDGTTWCKPCFQACPANLTGCNLGVSDAEFEEYRKKLLAGSDGNL